MIKKIFILLKSIIEAKIIFKNPEQKDAVIFNSYQLNIYKALFEKINYFCIEVPEKGSDDYSSLYGNLIEYPNLIKIDVDGNELDIINGFKKTVKEVKDVSLLVETRTLTHNKVEDELKRLGFKKVRQVNSNSIGTK